ncbi:unnamed protein product [Timema podura]|uniref:Uncharacterized protein n=1 Tax=Timema podura TaxID=61482 RepID=A0ABN7NPC7_TIMPD|nr:unnamed protein product [Timema podura]
MHHDTIRLQQDSKPMIRLQQDSKPMIRLQQDSKPMIRLHTTVLRIKKAIFRIIVPAFAWRESEKLYWEKNLGTLNRDLNLDIAVISSLVYCESSALNHAATKAGHMRVARTGSGGGTDLNKEYHQSQFWTSQPPPPSLASPAYPSSESPSPPASRLRQGVNTFQSLSLDEAEV